jgi:hypothetical protein
MYDGMPTFRNFQGETDSQAQTRHGETTSEPFVRKEITFKYFNV